MITWEISVPDSKSALGGRKPRGCVTIDPGGEREERLFVPKAVAKALKKKDEAGELHASSRAELIYLIEQQQLSCAATRIERLIDRRDYSAQEARDKLRLDGYWTKASEDVIARAERGHLIDDRRFADAFIRTKLSAGWGVARIERELKRRGVDPDEVAGWPEEYLDGGDEVERACAVGRRKRLTGKNDFQKLVRFLCARGFTTGQSVEAAKRLCAEASEADDG